LNLDFIERQTRAEAANRNPEGSIYVNSNNLCLPVEFVSNHENNSCGITPSKHVANVVVAIMTEVLEESFSLDEVETSVIENVAAVPVFVAKLRAKFLTIQKLYKQLLFELVRAMEMISDAVSTTEEFKSDCAETLRLGYIQLFCVLKMNVLK
jgi:hypothetical protein